MPTKVMFTTNDYKCAKYSNEMLIAEHKSLKRLTNFTIQPATNFEWLHTIYTRWLRVLGVLLIEFFEEDWFSFEVDWKESQSRSLSCIREDVIFVRFRNSQLTDWIPISSVRSENQLWTVNNHDLSPSE